MTTRRAFLTLIVGVVLRPQHQPLQWRPLLRKVSTEEFMASLA
jgi:hypothetical protein